MKTRLGIIISVIVSLVALLSGLAVFFAVRNKKLCSDSQ